MSFEFIVIAKVNEPSLYWPTRHYFHTFRVIILLRQKNAPKYVFHRTLKRQFERVKCTIFQYFSLKFWENIAW